MDPPGELPVPSPLDKPLGELTEDDIAQLTREDCRRFLKQKGMRRPSWNKSQAIQQVISLKALLDSRPDSGEGTRMKSLSASTPVTSPQAQCSSPYRRKDPNPNPIPPPVSLACGSRATDIACHSRAIDTTCVGANTPASQMTIFYGGLVRVYDDVPAEKAQALMQLAATPESYTGYPNWTVVPRIGLGPVSMPGKPVPDVSDNVTWSLTRECQPAGPVKTWAPVAEYLTDGSCLLMKFPDNSMAMAFPRSII